MCEEDIYSAGVYTTVASHIHTHRESARFCPNDVINDSHIAQKDSDEGRYFRNLKTRLGKALKNRRTGVHHSFQGIKKPKI